jgi:cytochrome c-type biogenesis protein CcmH
VRFALALALLAVGAAAQQPAPDVANARQAVGPPARPPLSGAALDAETQRVSLLLRCPVCQGLSVAESPSAMALNMRAQVRELLSAGYDEEQVLRYFERSYGEFVRLKPQLRGVNWLVWLAPVAGLILGGWVVRLALKKKPAASEAAVLRDDAELLPYLRRVRELAYGWPGGNPPEAPRS